MWQSSNTIRAGHDASNSALLPGGQYAEGWILFLPRIERIERIERSCPMEERRDQKVCCFPRAYALEARCVCSDK